ncbi:MAG: hypothetical protein H0W09_07270 [Solirubrobacterales bacterium]|nr:hypothetical protein [Solirubrobacterales bacterium]
MSDETKRSGDTAEEHDTTASKSESEGKSGGDSAGGHAGNAEPGEDPVNSPGPYGNPASDEEALRHEQQEQG